MRGCLTRAQLLGPLEEDVSACSLCPPPQHTLTRKAEEREAGQPAHSPGPCSLRLHQKEAWGPEDQPGPSQLQGGSRREGRGTTESQATELELAVPKAEKSESPTLLGVQRPVLSQTHTPSICSCPLAHANSLNPQPSAAHLPPHLCPPQAAFSMPCPCWKVCSHFCCFPDSIWSLQQKAAV